MAGGSGFPRHVVVGMTLRRLVTRRREARSHRGLLPPPATWLPSLRPGDSSMRKSARLVTTAGVTVLGLTAMSGMAQADTGGLKLPVDLTGPLAKTGPLGKTVDDV